MTRDITPAWRGNVRASRHDIMVCAALASCFACSSERLAVAEWDPPKPSTGQYLEAERATLSHLDGGVGASFTLGSDLDASAGSYLAAPDAGTFDDQPGPARATLDFATTLQGDYVVWGRIHSPTVSTNRFWFQIDDGSWHKWRISVGDIWYWDALHEDADYGVPLVFPLAAGPHHITFANCVQGVGLDRLYITADGDVPPGNDTPCNPPHSIEVAGSCQPSCGAQHGTQCGAQTCEGHTILSAYDCDVCCIVP